MSSVLDCGVFRRQSEGVPAHRVQHVVPAHPLVARHGVADGVISHVAHVQRAGRIRQHFEQIIFRTGSIVIHGAEGALLVPDLLPLCFDSLRIVISQLHFLPGSLLSRSDDLALRVF